MLRILTNTQRGTRNTGQIFMLRISGQLPRSRFLDDQEDGEGHMEQDEDDDVELVTEEQAIELEDNEGDGSVEVLEDLPNGTHNWVPCHCLLRPIRGFCATMVDKHIFSSYHPCHF